MKKKTLDQQEQIEAANRWISEITHRVMKTLECADQELDLDEEDVEYIVFTHADRLIGLGIVDARRSNEIDDLIIDNNLHR